MIGIIDWGIGGFGLVRALNKYGKFDYIYFSDSGYVPYGKVAEHELKNRVEQVIQFLLKKKVSKIVIACNAAGSVISNNNIFNIVQTGKEIISKLSNEEITIIGGHRIIDSGHYKLSKKHHLYSTQRLSAIVESGKTEKNKQEVIEIFKTLGPSKKIMLGCTHYPALVPLLQKEFPNIQFIDPAKELANKIKPFISFQKSHAEIFTTGSIKQLINSAKLAFDITLDPNQVQKIHL